MKPHNHVPRAASHAPSNLWSGVYAPSLGLRALSACSSRSESAHVEAYLPPPNTGAKVPRPSLMFWQLGGRPQADRCKAATSNGQQFSPGRLFCSKGLQPSLRASIDIHGPRKDSGLHSNHKRPSKGEESNGFRSNLDYNISDKVKRVKRLLPVVQPTKACHCFACARWRPPTHRISGVVSAL